MTELISQGKCLYCNQELKKIALTRHLDKHLIEKLAIGHAGKSFLLKIEPNQKWGAAPYFLFLWVDGNSKMEDIDSFLRNIWLECCGHMSAFKNPTLRNKRAGMWDFFEAEDLLVKGKTKEYEKLMEENNGEVPKSRKVKDALHKALKLEYEYDFGSTTQLQITVFAEYPIQADEKIVLLSRNEPLKILCEICGLHPATQICTVCMGEDESAFCSKCAKKHAKTCSDFDDYAAMPVVNSPRMGVCGYEGGMIDTKRDGIFVHK